MYLQGNVAVDPSQMTHIIRKKPTKAFKKMLYLLTAGAVSEKEEHETFCAIAILQQLNTVFRTMGITNIVHLAKDDVDFYLDEVGKEDDLKDAMENFKLEVDQIEASAFQTLKMVLEHEDDHLKYLIAVNIERVHRVGTFPIHIEVDGLIKTFRAQPHEGMDEVQARMRKMMPSQDAHDKLIAEKYTHFEHFLNELKMSMKKYVGVDEAIETHKKALVRPKGKVLDRKRLPALKRDAKRPVYYGYHGSDDGFLYAWAWSDMAHTNSWQISDCHVIDEGGSVLMDIAEDGIDAGASAALDPDSDFELPTDGSFEVGDSSEITPDMNPSDSGGGSWLGDVFSGGDGGDSGGSSCSSSSCSSSSCSSCGGGCGGCG